MKPLLRGVLLAVLLASAEAARADWVVQIAAFADSSFLRQMVKSIRNAGFPVTTEPLASAEGPALTRLLAGPYETKAQAQAAAVRLAAHGWPGYVKQRPEDRKPTPRPTPALTSSKKLQAAAPPFPATKSAATRVSVPAAPVRSERTPSPSPAPSTRSSPSLQPARLAEPPATSSAPPR